MKRLIIFVITIIAILSLISNVHAAWVLNGSPPCRGCEKNDHNVLIVEGASNFLQSYSQIFLLLNESELSSNNGFDFLKAKTAVDLALTKIIESKKYYSSALQCDENEVNNLPIIEKLKIFDYDRLIASRQLNPCVMEKITYFLLKGDLAGMYDKIIKDLENMTACLLPIKESIENNIIPDIENLRSLYQKYSDFMLLGYYSSLIFYEIRKEE